MKAVCMVAHPDDCVIFAWSLMHNFPLLDWRVAYLTYTESTSRAREFQQFWQHRGIATTFLGFTDDCKDIETGQCSFDTNAARDAVQSVISDADVILTHDSAGDYGHPHHSFVHRCVALSSHDHVITFAAPGQGTHHYHIDQPDYSSAELPLHWDIIKGFHAQSHRNSYTISATTYHRITNA